MTAHLLNTVRKKIANWANFLEILVKGIGPVIGVLWIGWQYSESRSDKRVEATLEYVKQFESDSTPIGRAQRAITDALWKHKDEFNDYRKTNASKEQKQEIRSTIVSDVLNTAKTDVKNTSVIEPIYELDDFFNTLTTCIQGNVCDKASALLYFGCIVKEYYLNDFATTFEDEDIERIAPRFGWGMKWIAAQTSQRDSCG